MALLMPFFFFNKQKQVYLGIAIGIAIQEMQAMADHRLMLS